MDLAQSASSMAAKPSLILKLPVNLAIKTSDMPAVKDTTPAMPASSRYSFRKRTAPVSEVTQQTPAKKAKLESLLLLQPVESDKFDEYVDIDDTKNLGDTDEVKDEFVVEDGIDLEESDVEDELDIEDELEVEDEPDHDSDTESVPHRKAKRASGGKPEKYYGNQTLNKPKPHGLPTVWAHLRQQLCESIPQYNAPQSAAYTNNGILYGFLVDKEVSPLDHFDEQVIITTLGGDKERDKKTGKTIYKTSSDNNARARAANSSMSQHLPVILIAGQGNKIAPSKLPYYYCVLGWFQVTDVWRETDKKIWKLRFEKINLAEKSWWAAAGTYPAGTEVLAPDYDTIFTEQQKCKACKSKSKHIYEQGWTCLQTSCKNFYRFDGSVDTSTLSYIQAFIRERRRYIGRIPDSFYRSVPVQSLTAGEVPYDVVKPKQGVVCQQCGCCTRRKQWTRYACENPGCDFSLSLNLRAIDVGDVAIPYKPGSPAQRESWNSAPSTLATIGLYTMREYVLDGPNGTIAGSVRIFKSNQKINSSINGPDELFHHLQVGDYKLSRHPARVEGNVSEVLTSHYASNFGALYKYKVTTNTTSFRDAPDDILRALKRLTWAGKSAVSQSIKPFEDFNELLMVCYDDKGQMNYHDDGESTLGPTVASLSLGCPALMKFRPKARGPVGGAAIMGSDGKPKGKPDVLKLHLSHGDLLVMHGEGVQKYYEHAVIPKGQLRFALTGRFVKPELMENEADREFARSGGVLPVGHEQFDYNGETDGIEGSSSDSMEDCKSQSGASHVEPTVEEDVQGLSTPALDGEVESDISASLLRDADPTLHDQSTNSPMLVPATGTDQVHENPQSFETEPSTESGGTNSELDRSMQDSTPETSISDIYDDLGRPQLMRHAVMPGTVIQDAQAQLQLVQIEAVLREYKARGDRANYDIWSDLAFATTRALG